MNITGAIRVCPRNDPDPNMTTSSGYSSAVARACLVIGLVLASGAGTARGQDMEDEPIREAGQQEASTGLGMQVLLTNSGFGLGGYARRWVAADRVVTFDVTLSNMKDEREVAFFDRFGQQDVPSKANYLLEIPFHIGLEQRLFRSTIEDNFRPFIHAAAGPVLGWTYPYFEDDNDNGMLDDGEQTVGALSGISRGRAVPGLSASVSIGANFGALEGSSQGVRLGFRISRYRDPIELIERSIKPPDRVFATPMIMVYFGRLR